jgi:hypothetical protein
MHHKSKILKRIFQYAKVTSIPLKPNGRYSHFAMRGFTPHLREVHLYIGESINKNKLWLAHDLLHIMFYDFASYCLGQKKWNEESRFYEIHLASEAFAVQSLDYHLLGPISEDSLTVTLNPKSYKKLVGENKKLPALLSEDFSFQHTEGYLTGNFLNWNIKKPSTFYLNWWQHEKSYSEKQRQYVQWWYQDLIQKQNSSGPIVVNGSAIHSLVWELLQILIYSDEKTWKAFLVQQKKSSRKINYFSEFKKYKSKVKLLDFRFQDMRATSREDVIKFLKKQNSPSPQGLFLFWQIFSSFKETSFSQKEKALIEDLYFYSQSQKNQSVKELWGRVKDLAVKKSEKLKKWKLQAPLCSTFFLP